MAEYLPVLVFLVMIVAFGGMLRTFDLAATDRRDLLLDKDRLHALGRQFEPSWATGTGLRAMQAPPARGGAKGEAAKDAAE